ncbi:hypothetical protein D3228_03115 [Leucobacter luti]|nr:hypothetical protein [Leucobacter luti]
MRRPLWILALLLALAVAGTFAWLGQWQMGIAVRAGAQEVVDTETPRALAEVSDLAKGVTEEAAGVVVDVSGRFVPGDSRIVSPRQNGDEIGVWVVGHFITDPPERAHLAVAIGWAPDTATAERAIEALDADAAISAAHRLEGRYMPPEGPQVPGPKDDPQAMTTMIPAHFANVWSDVDAPVYSGYLVLHDQGSAAALLPAGELDPIDSVAPLPPEKVNWLNVFYAIEWVVFAGFAVFFWFRLTRDAWEKEHELMELQAEAATHHSPE